MTIGEVEAVKADLRAGILTRRAGISQEARAEAAQAACTHFFNEIIMEPGQVVAAYWPVRDEFDCQPILVRLMGSGQPVCLPVVAGADAPLVLRLWRDGEALYPAGFGTLAPAQDAPLAVPDIVILPLVGFDARGTRLGYGGGYYDRTLAGLGQKPRLIGLAFDAQEVDDIPRQDHDVPLDAIVTENGVRHFSMPHV